MHFSLASSRTIVTILISFVFRDTVLIRGEVLIRGRHLISMWTPKSAAFIRGQSLSGV